MLLVVVCQPTELSSYESPTWFPLVMSMSPAIDNFRREVGCLLLTYRLQDVHIHQSFYLCLSRLPINCFPLIVVQFRRSFFELMRPRWKILICWSFILILFKRSSSSSISASRPSNSSMSTSSSSFYQSSSFVRNFSTSQNASQTANSSNPSSKFARSARSAHWVNITHCSYVGLSSHVFCLRIRESW